MREFCEEEAALSDSTTEHHEPLWEKPLSELTDRDCSIVAILRMAIEDRDYRDRPGFQTVDPCHHLDEDCTTISVGAQVQWGFMCSAVDRLGTEEVLRRGDRVLQIRTQGNQTPESTNDGRPPAIPNLSLPTMQQHLLDATWEFADWQSTPPRASFESVTEKVYGDAEESRFNAMKQLINALNNRCLESEVDLTLRKRGLFIEIDRGSSS